MILFQKFDHVFVRRRTLIQPTKKLGCPIKVYISRFLRFPDYKVLYIVHERLYTLKQTKEMCYIKVLCIVLSGSIYIVLHTVIVQAFLFG